MSTQIKMKFKFRWLMVILTLAIPFSMVLSACKSDGAEQAGDAQTASQADAGTSEDAEAKTDTATAAEAPLTLEELAKLIADEFGEIQEVNDNGSDTPVFVFGEIHASNFERIDIAIMLNRLYATQNLDTLVWKAGLRMIPRWISLGRISLRSIHHIFPGSR